MVGLLIAGAVSVLGTAGLIVAARQPLGPLALIELGVAALVVAAAGAVGTVALGHHRLRIRFAPGELIVEAGGHSARVRLDEIDGVFAGQRIGPLPPVRGVSWPGYHIGPVRIRGHSPGLAFCTDRRIDSLSVIVTPTRTLVLTPVDPPAFRRELIRRIEQHSATEADVQPRPWFDRIQPAPLATAFVALAISLLLTSLLRVLAFHQTLPELVALQLDTAVTSTVLSPRGEVFNLPLLGAAVLTANLALAALLRRRERSAVVLLAGAACLVQGCLVLAAMRLSG